MKDRHKIDWDAARSAIERTRDRVGRKVASADYREQIFRQRAEILARPLTAPTDTRQQHSLLVFWVEADRFALPLSIVTEVLAGLPIAAVPGAPPNVAGVIQVRGEIRPVFHLNRLLETASAEQQDTVLLVRHRNREVGLRIGRVEDIRSVSQDDLREGPEDNPRVAQMTADFVQILDLDILLDEKWEAGEPG